jgi:hypothetical protein
MGADSAHPSGQATLTNCTLTGNAAAGGVVGSSDGGDGGSGGGGAIFNLDGQVTLDSDTLDANFVSGGAGGDGRAAGQAAGGAVANLAYGNDIDTGNQAAASLVLNNSILANTGNGALDLASVAVNGKGTNTATVSGSHNLVMSSSGTLAPGVVTLTADPRLGLLQDNGGLTQTMLPSPGSPVLGAGDPTQQPTLDQRGLVRPTGGPIDLGAVQVTDVSNSGGGGGGSSSGGGGSSSAHPPTPAGPLAVFALGISPSFAFDLLSVDSRGDVFAQSLSLSGALGSPVFISNPLWRFEQPELAGGQLLALFDPSIGTTTTTGSGPQTTLGVFGAPYLVDIFENFSNPFVLSALEQAIAVLSIEMNPTALADLESL